MDKEKIQANSAKLAEIDFSKILIAVLVILITLVFIAIYRRRKGAKNVVLITGLCDSGKTLLLSQLVHKKAVQTHTSIIENKATYIINNDYLKVVDVPGHERLRDKFIEQYKNLSRGLIFVVDSSTIQRDVRDAAEFLYNILTDPIISNNSPNVLILCNKQDQTLAKGSNAVRSILEKELNTLRVTKSSQLESVDPKAKRIGGLGDSGKDFSFSSLHLKVDFAESCAFHKNGIINVDDVHKWLSDIA